MIFYMLPFGVINDNDDDDDDDDDDNSTTSATKIFLYIIKKTLNIKRRKATF